MNDWKSQQVLIVGGGIGGLAAALALARKGIASQVIEQAAEFKEIGAGIQLGPNVFWMFEALGLIEPINALAVFPNNLIMMDSVTGQEVTRIPLGETFRKKFHHPYALIHRADLHKVLLEACRKSNVLFDLLHQNSPGDRENTGVYRSRDCGGRRTRVHERHFTHEFPAVGPGHLMFSGHRNSNIERPVHD